MQPEWGREILRSSERKTEDDERRFLALVDEAYGNCSLDVARVLMKTFSDRPDYGTQERVVSVLATARDSDFLTALLEELPRMIGEAPDWAEVLVGGEVDNRPARLSATAGQMPVRIKNALRQVILSEDFEECYPNARSIAF